MSVNESYDYLKKYQEKHFTKSFVNHFGEELKKSIDVPNPKSKKIKIKWTGWNMEVKIPTDYFTNRILGIIRLILSEDFDENSIVINPKRIGVKNRIYNVMLIHDKNKGNNPYVMYWYQYHKNYNLPKNLLGKKIMIYNRPYIICGINPSNKKHVFRIKDKKGEIYKTNVSTLVNSIQK